MPTFERTARFLREFRRLSPEKQAAFLRAIGEFVDALRTSPATFPAALRIKRVQGHEGVWEMSFAPDGRATFTYGDERTPGQPHVVWRRIGDHSIFRQP